MSSPRFLVLVLDGLRPDLVTSALMPHLSAFKARSSVVTDSRAQFPTQTRVNKVSFATGSTPHHHGVHFNKFFDPRLTSERIIDIGDMAELRAAEDRAPIVTATTLGEALAGAGKRFALVHCGAPGAPWLLNFRGDRLGHEHISMAGYQYSTPKAAAAVEAKLGALPSPEWINLDRSHFALKAATEVLFTEFAPDVTMIWSDEPDKSFHVDGLVGPASLAAITAVDELVAKAIAWWETIGQQQDVQLIILSDHGHVQRGSMLEIKQAIAQSGLSIVIDPLEAGRAVMLPFGGGIYLRDQNADFLAEIAAWLQKQPWCGSMFSDDADGLNGVLPGTFSKTLVNVDHPRAPDLFFSLNREDGPADAAYQGFCVDTGKGQAQGSTHGGLHWSELRTVMLAAGSAFRENYTSSVPAGMVDIVPTMLDLLGIERPKTMAGRALRDLYAAGGEQEDTAPTVETLNVEHEGFRQSLTLRRLARRNIVDGGSTE